MSETDPAGAQLARLLTDLANDPAAPPSTVDAQSVIRAARSAAVADEGQPSVWLIDEAHGRLIKKDVEVSSWTETSAIVSGGLETGQKIVAAGVHKLDAGIPVRIIEVVQ